MNSFFCKVNDEFTFTGRMNDDVNTYTTLGSRGKVFLTLTNIDLIQQQTQQSSGGNNDVYQAYGTYVKSFYSVMSMPSAVKIHHMGDKHFRIHHLIEYDNCVPKIVSDKFKR